MQTLENRNRGRAKYINHPAILCLRQAALNPQKIIIQPVQPREQKPFQSLMAALHNLGGPPNTGHMPWCKVQSADEDEDLSIDEDGRQAHIMAIVGLESDLCHTQKSRCPACRRPGNSQSNETGMFIPFLDTLDIDAETHTGADLLTQCKLTRYLAEEHKNRLRIV